MTQLPSFLPPQIPITADRGQQHDQLYRLYTKNLRQGDLYFYGRPVVVTRVGVFDGKEEMFWHLILHGQRRGIDGAFDSEKVKRFNWIRPIIENAKDDSVIVFNYKYPDKPPRTYLWVKSLDYVVILEAKKQAPNGDICFYLITAFYFDFSSKRRDMEKKFSNRIVY